MARLDIHKKDDTGGKSTLKEAGAYEECPYIGGVLRTSRFWGQFPRNQANVCASPSEKATFGS